jgi:uncharacterized protein YjiS (DUF1127 family)
MDQSPLVMRHITTIRWTDQLIRSMMAASKSNRCVDSPAGNPFPAHAGLLPKEATMIMPLTLPSVRSGSEDKSRKAVSSTWNTVIRIAAYPVRFYQARRDIALLAAMDDAQLRDIGLSRIDVANAAALPLERSPTEALSELVAERRRHPRLG